MKRIAHSVLNAVLGLTLFNPVVSSQVVQDWMAVYDGPSGSIDSVRAVAVDDIGNVLVVGSSTSSTLMDYTTLKYDQEGQLLWEARYDGPGHFRDDARWLALDNSGNVYITGSSRSGVQAGTEDFATVKYNSDGVRQWVAVYDGPGGSVDVAAKVAVDNMGNVYVTGHSYEIGIDYATIKYDPNGVQQWVARYNGPGNSLDAPTGLAVDGVGNVYVTGWSRSTSLYGSEDYLTIKYNTNGVQQWVARYNGPSNQIDQAKSIALDESGNTYVTGSRLSPSTQNDYVTIKYSPDGAQLWIASYNNEVFNGSDIARMVIVDESENVYVTGTSGTAYPFGYPNFVTVKYNGAGTEQWVASYNGPGNADDTPLSIASDDLGNIYVTGRAAIPGFVYDFATVKYDAGGAQVWEVRFNGASNLNDGATWVDVDHLGNVYVAGNSMYNTNYASDFVTIKYSQSDPGGFQAPVVSDISNQTLARGERFLPLRMDDYVFDPDTPDPEITWSWSGNTVLRVVLDPSRRRIGVRAPNNWTGSETITFTATDPSGLSDSDPATFTVSPAGIVVAEMKSSQGPEVTGLLGNYPNPFNPSTTIRYALSKEARVNLKVYSILGQEVATLVEGVQPAGYYSVVWNSEVPVPASSGIYLYSLHTDEIIQTGRMILTK